ncbi:hypothetical protein QBC35DRAFT_388842 [Podospora australis]|uniref:Amidoligase enzyme-domain-containing protein n=1 Tax=Podospora australis TaxID=1536484 RepID=A0AAN7AGF7_9PEZI|nr:hypothetical protein QBC35DRAFT_388842 [Podospora australis]
MDPTVNTVLRWSASHRVPSYFVEQELSGWGFNAMMGTCCQALREISAPQGFSYGCDHGVSKHSMGDTTDLNGSILQGSTEEYTDHPEDITIAIEVKYLVPLLLPGAVDPEPHDTRSVATALDPDNHKANQQQVTELLSQTLRKAGEKAVPLLEIVSSRLEQRDFWNDAWIIKKAGSPEPSAKERALQGYVWVPVELVSPKMLAKDPSTVQRMRRVLERLVSSHRLVANYSCDTHCHVGRSDDRAYTLSTLKRLATLLWPAEEALRSIRDRNSPNYNNEYTWGFEMRYSRLGKSLHANRVCGRASEAFVAEMTDEIPDKQVVKAIYAQEAMSARELQAFREIWKQNSHEGLGKLLSGDEAKYRRLGFNFSAFGLEDERARTNPRTMEFRFMEGTLRPDLVASWMIICGTIAEVAISRSDSRFEVALARLLHKLDGGSPCTIKRLLERRGRRLGRDFRDLMEDLGVPLDVYRAFLGKVIQQN